jgi:hypothetical protein
MFLLGTMNKGNIMTNRVIIRDIHIEFKRKPDRDYSILYIIAAIGVFFIAWNIVFKPLLSSLYYWIRRLYCRMIWGRSWIDDDPRLYEKEIPD